MGETKVVSAGEIQKGSYIVVDGAASRVVSVDISKTGKHGHAKSRIQAVGLIDNKKREMVIPTHDNVEVPIIEKRTAQVLSVHDNTANVMDADTFETFDIEIPEEMKADVVSGTNVLYWVILDKRVMKQTKGGE
jgi:translation initiation factor 5A